MPATLQALLASPPGRFVQKFLDDRGTNLAILLAWGMLTTLVPLFLAISAIAGLVLQDPERLAQVNDRLFVLFPPEVAQPLARVLVDARQSAGALGVIGLGLLVWFGSGLFVAAQGVFNRAYHVQDRSFVGQRVLALAMLLVTIVLLLLSTLTASLVTLVQAVSRFVWGLVPFNLPGEGTLVAVVGWLISFVSALLMFLILYTVLPNKPQSWRRSLPGATVAAILYFLVLQLFPLYLTYFGERFQTYAVFGFLLLVMFWAYVLGLVLVFGAELNAFLEQPRLAEEPPSPDVPSPLDPPAAGEQAGASASRA